MNRTHLFVVALCATLWPLLSGCSPRDRTTNVDENDPEMVAAIAKARGSLPQFWQAFDKQERGTGGFALKVKITDKHGTEHFWATRIERRDGKTTGTIDNDPNTVASVKLGDRIEIREADISDWLYLRNGKMVGNETVRPLIKTMSAAEAAEVKAMLANP